MMIIMNAAKVIHPIAQPLGCSDIPIPPQLPNP
jgi:hypothetical protein